MRVGSLFDAFIVEITRMTSSYNPKQFQDILGLENNFFERRKN
jgi:hypothetical protein